MTLEILKKKKVCVFYLLAEGSKWIQSLLVLGGVAHHSVVTTSSLRDAAEKTGFRLQ